MFPLLYSNLVTLAKKIDTESDDKLELESSPFASKDETQEVNLIDKVAESVNEKFFDSFLSLKENVFSIPGQDMNIKFTSDKEFPTTFKAVSVLESQRDIIESYEINQFIKIEQELQNLQIQFIKDSIKKKLTQITRVLE